MPECVSRVGDRRAQRACGVGAIRVGGMQAGSVQVGSVQVGSVRGGAVRGGAVRVGRAFGRVGRTLASVGNVFGFGPAGSAVRRAIGAAGARLVRVGAVAAIGALLAAPPLAAAPGVQAPASSPGSPLPSRAAHEIVVVTATVAPSPLASLGRSVDLITREEIAPLPIATATDLLRLLSSVEVRARGPFDVQADFSVRGAGFGQALVMVDGVRLNDAQSGHHNADIPVPLDAIERVEVLRGAGSSLHGADAFGGTINIITRRGVPRPSLTLAGGSFDLAEASGAAGVTQAVPRVGAIAHAIHGSVSRSSGFMPARDHRVATLQYQASTATQGRFLFAHTDKAFGANGFYGPAPSREWTRQTLIRFERPLLPSQPESDAGSRGGQGRWQGTWQTAFRSHGDHFVYDETQPQLSESRHRTHAVSGQAKLYYTASAATRIAVGAEAGGDWIRSNNLGDHSFGRGSLFAEWQQSLGDRILLQPGLRFDAYSRFGNSLNPSVAASVWASPRVKVRASAGHAFRVPTFTELYYRDPNHQASSALDPERAWAADAGVDLLLARGWTGALTVFGRWEDNVIDWVRPSTAERWQTTNIRRVDTQGIETSVRRRFGARVDAAAQYTWQRLDADPLSLLSKYALDYAAHSFAAFGAVRAGAWTVGPRVELKRRVDGREYWVVDARVGHRFGRWELYVDGANLLNSTYEEISGVPMPGRWGRIGLRTR